MGLIHAVKRRTEIPKLMITITTELGMARGMPKKGENGSDDTSNSEENPTNENQPVLGSRNLPDSLGS